MSRRMYAALAATVVAFAATACGTDRDSGNEGQSLADIIADTASLTAEARQARLIELAKAEGPITWYTSTAENVATELANDFTADTGISVNLYRATNQVLATRLSQEAQARRPAAAVVSTDGATMFTLAEQGLLTDYASPAIAGLVEGSDFDGWIAERENVFTVSWNTTNVPAGTEPASYADLAESTWAGRLGMIEDDYDWMMALYTYLVNEEGYTEAEADELFRGMARNSVLSDSHSGQLELVAAGEYDVAVSAYSYEVDRRAAQGAPVAWKPLVAPVFIRPNGIGVVADTPTPAGALLFVDWMLTTGQDKYAAVGLTPARADLAPDFGEDGRPVDIAVYVRDRAKWVEKYKELVIDMASG